MGLDLGKPWHDPAWHGVQRVLFTWRSYAEDILSIGRLIDRPLTIGLYVCLSLGEQLAMFNDWHVRTYICRRGVVGDDESASHRYIVSYIHTYQHIYMCIIYSSTPKDSQYVVRMMCFCEIPRPPCTHPPIWLTTFILSRFVRLARTCPGDESG